MLRNLTRRDRDVALVAATSTGKRITLRPAGGPAGGARREIDHDFDDRPSRGCGSRAAPPLRHHGRDALRGSGEPRRRRRLRVPLRRQEARAAARRHAAPERQAAQPAGREHPRGRPRGGGALTRAHADAAAAAACSDLGATITRSHYPLHPAIIEMLDRAGILFWIQAPVYQLPNDALRHRAVRAPRHPRRRADGRGQHEPRLDHHLVARQRARASRSELGGVGPGLDALHPGRVGRRARIDDTRLSRSTAIAPRRAAHIARPSATSTCSA